jgi:hypothetical protein
MKKIAPRGLAGADAEGEHQSRQNLTEILSGKVPRRVRCLSDRRV